MGYGALLVGGAFLFLFTLGLAGRGAVGGDVFVVGSIGFVVAMVSLFIFMPIVQMLANAMVTQDGTYSLGGCSSPNCSATGSGALAASPAGRAAASPGIRCSWPCSSACSPPLLGLVFALVVTRTGFRYGKAPAALTVLPIITPPFVIGLGASSCCSACPAVARMG